MAAPRWNRLPAMDVTVGPTFTGSKADPIASAEIDTAERAAGRDASPPPEQQQRSPGLAAHIADAVRHTKRQAPPHW